MILQLNKKRFALNLGEDFEYINTYIKGKRGKHIADNYRLHFRGVTTGQDILIFIAAFSKQHYIGMRIWYQLHILQFNEIMVSDNKNHIKNCVYNYYKLDADPSRVDEVLTAWKNSDPMVHVGNYEHQFITAIKDYTAAYKFNGKSY